VGQRGEREKARMLDMWDIQLLDPGGRGERDTEEEEEEEEED
jgi:hypothetical protein